MESILSRKTLFKNINILFKERAGDMAISALADKFRSLTDGLNSNGGVCRNIRPIATIYEEALLVLEEYITATGFKPGLLTLLKEIFGELEDLLALQKTVERHSFLVVIPLADRPTMLKNCLESILRQCTDFNYGGKIVSDLTGDHTYARIAVLVMDDSKDIANINAHKTMARDITRAGLRTHYIGLAEQSGVVSEIPESFWKDLRHIIGDCADGVRSHKGASVTRNIAYLWINRYLKTHPEKTLIYFIDSDEEFAIKVETENGSTNINLINYFYWLDKLFTSEDIEILTGKVVGDPPVSPAIMINTFLDDVLLFFKQISGCSADDPCIFHGTPSSRHSPAHYNDLVKMFGYKSPAQACPYPCPIKGKHTISDAFKEFSEKINGFFYGLHPTRETIYYYNGGPLNIAPARTVYTGNFILRPEALRYVIPYADLKLRMAGPALGRLLKARIGKRFVSANLPLLHKRTLATNHQGEFRPGINNQDKGVNLTDESIRQFWGDVLLFSVEELTKYGYPDTQLRLESLANVVNKTKEKMWRLYTQNNEAISEKMALLKDYLTNPEHWWNRSEGLKGTVGHYKAFCSNVEFNFGIQSKGYQELKDTFVRRDFSSRIAKALYDFYEDERLWHEVLNGDSVDDSAEEKPGSLSVSA
jgi:glycosyltransferase involved in cell wall biosynthesis